MERREEILRVLTVPQRCLFDQLSPFDQDHAICVCDTLVAGGNDDRDLLVAGLLHDAGKVWHGISPGLIDRAMKVTLSRFSPSLLRTLADYPHRMTLGLHIITHHARLGAKLAAGAGSSARVCALIERHEEPISHGDAMLSALQQADRVC